MKIATEAREDHQIKITIEVDTDEIDSAKRRAARKIAKQVKIPGFRPGKAPYPVIERQVGGAAILEEAIEILANDLYPKALDETGIEPYGPGMLENVSNVDPVVLEFITPLEAQVEIGDYKSIRHPYELAPITDEDVQATISEIRNRQAITEPVERAAQEGDQVRIKLSAQRLNPQEEEHPVLIEERTLPVTIEAEGADAEEWPFPGFSRALIGLEAQAEKSIIYSFPEDSNFDSLRGVEAEFHISVEQISQRILPELDDEFASTVGEVDTLSELEEQIRKELEESREHDYNHQYEDEVISILIDQASIKYPPQMIERELNDLIEDLGNRLTQQGLDLETYLKYSNKDMDSLRTDLRDNAEKRLKRSLILFKVATLEEIKLNPEDVQEETEAAMGYLSQAMPEKEFRKINTRDRIQHIVGNIMMDMLIGRTIERLRMIASGQWQAELITDEITSDEEDESSTPISDGSTGEEPVEVESNDESHLDLADEDSVADEAESNL